MATSRATRLVLVVRLEVLLHVVGPGKLLLAARKGALDSLFGSMNLGVARGMARGSECLLAAMRVAEAARVALGRAILAGHGDIIFVGGGAATGVVQRALCIGSPARGL